MSKAPPVNPCSFSFIASFVAPILLGNVKPSLFAIVMSFALAFVWSAIILVANILTMELELFIFAIFAS